MRYLEHGLHEIDAPALYDWATNSVSSTRLLVGQAGLSPPPSEYFIDFSYLVPQQVTSGQVHMDKFDCARQALEDFSSALRGQGIEDEAVADKNVLYCRGAAYHEDGAFNTLFATALWHGEPGDVVFPRLNVRVRMEPGTFIVFDCHEPHGMLKPGLLHWQPEDYQDAPLSHLLSFDMDRLNGDVREMFGLREAMAGPPAGAVPTRGKALCSRTGRYS